MTYPQQPSGDRPGEPTGRPDAPPSGWTPTPLSSKGRPSFGATPTPPTAPGTPLGGQALPSVSIQEFAPPRSRLPLIVVLVALLVAGLIWAGTTLRAPRTDTTATASPSPSATATASGLPFVSPDQNASGRWEIVNHRWSDAGVEVEIRIAADEGPVGYSFVAFGNDDVQATRSEPGLQEPRLSGSPIASGEQATGWVFFRLERGATTIILATSEGNQMSALPVAG